MSGLLILDIVSAWLYKVYSLPKEAGRCNFNSDECTVSCLGSFRVDACAIRTRVRILIKPFLYIALLPC